MGEDFKEIHLYLGELAEKFSAKVLVERCAEFTLFKAKEVDMEMVMKMPLVTGSYMRMAKEMRETLISCYCCRSCSECTTSLMNSKKCVVRGGHKDCTGKSYSCKLRRDC